MTKFYLMVFVSVLCVFKTKAQMIVFDDNYAAGVTFAPFGGSVNNLSIDNSQKHSGTSSLKIPVTTGYTGGALVSAAPTNLSAYNAVTFWAKNDMPYMLDGAGLGNNASTTVFAGERNGLAITSTWTKFIIPIPVPSKLTAETGLFHFAEGSGEGMYNIWIDDVQYENIGGGVIGIPTASFATETQSKEVGATFSANGTTAIFPVNAVNQQMQVGKGYFTWTSSNLAVATFDGTGTGTALTAGSTTVTGKLGAVDAGGILTVNVTAVTGPAVAAPTPNRASADVVSLFSNAYTANPVDTWSTGWSSGNHQYTELQVAGNDTKKYQLAHFAGVEFITSFVDATNLGFLHIDVWTPDANKPFTIRLVNFGASNTEADVTRTPTQGTWMSYDIPLSEFATLGGKNKLSQMLFLVAGGTTGTFFIDNVYFYKTGVILPSDPTTAAPTPPVRNASDVISLFSGAYTDLAGTEWFPNWGQSTVVSEVNIAGDPTKKYVNFNYQGVQFASPINASGMSKLHLDIWTPDAITFEVYPIVPGQPEVAKQLTPVRSEWNSYDIDLATIGTTPLTNIIQFKFVGLPAGSKVYLDNIYFHKGTVLPVKFIDFTATRINNTTSLSWSTASEQNNKGFGIERSADGKNWAEIDFIASKGSGNTKRTYAVNDLTPGAGINYYRIRQVDHDGGVSFSVIRSLSFEKGGLKLALFPNPAKDKVSISIGNIGGSKATYSILSTDGRLLKSGQFDKSLSNTVQRIDISKMAKGYYIIKLVDGKLQQSATLNID
ncbi:MAG: T9SS type A sorting domain-containing protein [Bacteroidota bacterium]